MKVRAELTLTGSCVQLVPLEASHKEALYHAVGRPEVWEFTWGDLTVREDMDRAIDSALLCRQQGSQIPFAVVLRESGRIVGTTRIGDIDEANRSARSNASER